MASDALATLLRELSDPATALEAAPGIISQLRRRGLLRPPASAAMVTSFGKRVTELLRHADGGAKLAGTMLLQELLHTCDEPTFAQQREAWCNVLLTLLQPPPNAAGAGAARQGQRHTLQQAAAVTLSHVVGAAAAWPAQRRELSGCASRLVGALVPIVSAPAETS